MRSCHKKFSDTVPVQCGTNVNKLKGDRQSDSKRSREAPVIHPDFAVIRSCAIQKLAVNGKEKESYYLEFRVWRFAV